MDDIRYYIIFPNHTEGMKLESLLKKEKIKYTIVPTPRELSSCCGISIMYNKEDEARIKKVIDCSGISVTGMHELKKKLVNYYLG